MIEFIEGLFFISLIGIVGFVLGCLLFVITIIFKEFYNNTFPFNKKETMFGIIFIIILTYVSAYVGNYYSPYQNWR